MQNPPNKTHWVLNKDGILQKYEADYWGFVGKGKPITVDGNRIDTRGFEIINTSTTENVFFEYQTTDMFDDLPYETASTYGGSIFKRVNGQWQMQSQAYHYGMRPWLSSFGNFGRNTLTVLGTPKVLVA